MPRYTVVGTVSVDQMTFQPIRVWPGERRDKVPPGGWGHCLSAATPREARAMALAAFEEYAAGGLAYEIEVEIVAPAGIVARATSWLPWRKRREVESLGRLPIV